MSPVSRKSLKDQAGQWRSYDVVNAVSIAQYIGQQTEDSVQTYSFGIDVSNNNGDIVPWSVIAKIYDYVAMKATEGLHFIDQDFADNWAAAGDYGLTRIAYHLARPSQGSGRDEADFFLNVAGKNVQSGDIFALDSEDTNVAPKAGLADHHLDFYHTADPAWGASGLLYSGLWYMQPHGLTGNAELASHGLWIAQYGTSKVVALPAGWQFWALHQYGQGPVPGFVGAVDLDRFAGTVSQLRKYGKP